MDNEKAGGSPIVEAWEDCWESGEFPFVRLDHNRASCAICLLDFEEPKRRVARDVIRSWAQKNQERLRGDDSEEQVMKKGGNDDGGDSESGKDGDRKEDKEGEQNADEETNGAGTSNQAPDPSAPGRPEGRRRRSTTSSSSSSSNLSIRLEDAGEGAQPLRLLPCGHAFHVSSP